MSEIVQRVMILYGYAKKKGICKSMLAFERYCNVSRFYFSTMKRDNAKSIGSDVAKNILDAFPEISPEWLLCGRGSMIRIELHLHSCIEEARKLIRSAQNELLLAMEMLDVAEMDTDDIPEENE
jgi:hypothetical protein